MKTTQLNETLSEILRPFNGPIFYRNIEQDFYEDLIGFVEENEPLWRKTSRLYKDTKVKLNCWHKIFASLQEKFGLENLKKFNAGSVNDLKLRWQNKRDVYKRKRDEAKGRSGSSLAQVNAAKKWQYYVRMEFLEESGNTQTNKVITSHSRPCPGDKRRFFGDEEYERQELPDLESSSDSSCSGKNVFIDEIRVHTMHQMIVL